ncbi:MAG: polysaccharide deacetylase family protein [Henriciella sp.]
MTDFVSLPQKIGGAIDRALCETFEKREREIPAGRYVSLCFDDFPKTAATVAAPMVEELGWRATYYVAGGFLGTTRPQYGTMFDDQDLHRLHQNGHDFGCHTFDHIDCRTATSEEIEEQCKRNLEFLARRGITDVKSFAFPFGAANLTSKRILSNSEFALRGVKTGLNRGRADLDMLRACGLQDNKGGTQKALKEIETLKNSDGWLILFTHDVQDKPSPWGVTPEDYRELLAAIDASGAEVITVGDMVTRMQPYASQADLSIAS